MRFSTEFNARIYNDESGDYLTVGPGPDSDGLIVIKSIAVQTSGPRVEGEIIIPAELALELVDAIRRVVDANPDSLG